MTCPFCQKGPVWYSRSLVKGFVRMLLLSPARYCFSCRRRWQKHTLATMFMGMLLQPKFLLITVSLLVAYLVTVSMSASFSPWDWMSKRFQKYAASKFDSGAPAAPPPSNVVYRNMDAKQRREFENYIRSENLR